MEIREHPNKFRCHCGLPLAAVPPRVVCPGCNSAYIRDDLTGRWFPSFAWPTWTQVSFVGCSTLAGLLWIRWEAWPAALVTFLAGFVIVLWDRERRIKIYDSLPRGPRPWWAGLDRLMEGLDLMGLVLLLGVPMGLFLGWLIWRWFIA